MIAVTVVHCPGPGRIDQIELRLPEGARVRDAVRESGLAQRHAGLDPARTGVWGRLQPPDAPLRDGDRVELYRPLQVDPKEARRLRWKGQKAARRPR